MALTKIITDGITDDAVTEAKLANAINTARAANTAKTGLGTNAVQTSHIADEQITLAKLEHGTSSNDGKFLRANNGADPTFETVETGARAGGTIFENLNSISTAYTVTNNSNAFSVGPMTIASGGSVTVGSGETYTIFNF